MSGIFLKWGVPAFVTVIGGTAAAIATSGSAIPPDLTARTEAALAGPEHDWATLAVDMRDVTLTGTATTQQMIDAAVARVAAVHGVRSVTPKVVLAEYVSPFPFMADITGGKLTLSGGLPDEEARAHILARAGAGALDNSRLMSGAPDRATWLAAVDYALSHAAALDEGEVALADLSLTVSGRAATPDAYAALADLARSPAPAGVDVTFREITPPLMSPFEWRAEYGSSGVSLSGAVPSEALLAELTATVPQSIPVATSLVLASGAPPDFAETATLLLQNLLKLENGSAVISGGTSTLSGSPADPQAVESVRLAMKPAGTTLDLGPPLVTEYWLSAERTPDGIRLDGFAPDQATLDRLEALDQVDASGLELGRGAPERFQSAVDFVISTLRRTSEGHATLQGTVITIEARAATLADFDAINGALGAGAPQGLTLATTTIEPPLAAPFTFAAEKSEAGQYALSGYVPGSDAREALLAALPTGAADRTVIADGEPAGFESAAREALAVLSLLDSGRVSYDGAAWSISGSVDTPQKAFVAESAFRATGLRAAGWTYSVTLPGRQSVAALPVVDPYAWRAQKGASGGIALSGFVPTEQLKRYLLVTAGEGAVDGTALGAGAPDGFVAAVLAGMDALRGLDEGTLSLAAGNWSLTGAVSDTETRHRVEAALRGAIDASTWHVAIQAADAAPVVAPFRWSAVRAADGSFNFSGYVPTEDLRGDLAARAGKVATDTTLVGSGEPEGFGPDALAGLEALLHLDSGEVRFDGHAWSITGQPATASDAAAAKAALASATGGGAGWNEQLAAPTVGEPAITAQTVEPAETEAAPPATQPSAEAAAALPLAEDEGQSAVPVEPATPDASAVSSESKTQTEPVVPAEPLASVEPAPAATEATEPAAPVGRDFVFEARKSLGGEVAFTGAVPAEPMRRYLAVITGGEPSEALVVRPDLPEDFVANANAGSRALALLADGELGLDGAIWVLTGRAETEAGRQAALSELAAVPNLPAWQTDITLLPPIEVCRRKVDSFAARNAILFKSGSALIAEDSLSAIDELAGYLSLCPDAAVSVEGHTDADGEEDANLALSVSRAEAVVDALIQRGVGPEQLYAVGYGESLPIASNETRAGKQANRRIAFTISEQ